jgi:hypothetical protein
MELSNHPVDVGQRSETAILAAFIERGFLVWLPWGVNSRADMLLAVPGKLLRIQCKSGRLRKGAVMFSAKSVRANMNGVFSRNYIGEIDYFAVYCPDNRRVFIPPCDETTRSDVSLRLEPTANCQNRRIRWAADYALERFRRRAGEGTRTPGPRFTRALLYQLSYSGARLGV